MSDIATIKSVICQIAAVGIACASLAFLASPVEATGYAQGFQGAPSAGVGGAMTARPNTPEAGYYNPAGFALQDDWGAYVGGSLLFPLVYHEDEETRERTRAQVDGAFPPALHAYGSFGDFAAGLSLGIPYGASLQWPDDWPGRFEATSTSLSAMEAAPSVAWQPTDWLAIGGGPRVVWGTMGFGRALDFAREDEEGFVELEASAPGVGAQLGAWGQVHDLWSVGASWRSAIDLGFEGTARFEDIPEEMEDQAHDTRAETDMILPHRFALGVAYELAAAGVISLDLEYSLWSAFDTYEVRFDSDDINDIEEARDWSNTISMRAGVEYFAPVDGLSLRTGITVEPSPAPEETLSAAQPNTDRTSMSLGGGFEAVEGVNFDIAYNFIMMNRTASADEGMGGIYDGQIHVFSLGVTVGPGWY